MSTPVRLPASRAGTTARGAVTPAGRARPAPVLGARVRPAPVPDRRAGPAPRPLRLAVVGAGRAGRALATALVAAGHHVVAVASRTPASARALAGTLAAFPHAAAPRLCGSPRDVAASAADLVLVAVPDAAIAGVVAELLPVLLPGQVVAHLSGAHGTAVLEPVLARGADALALHPAMTFVGDAADADRLTAGVTFGVTASAGAAAVAARLVAELRGHAEWIAEADRVRYHAALAHGANHLVTLVNDAADLARRAGVADPAALLAPLLRAALENVLAGGDAALTGPVARGDAATVAAHLADLAAAAPETADAYRALARRAAARAAGRHTPDQAAALRAVLDPTVREAR